MDHSPSLPQHDAANAEDRKQLLYAARQQYQYDHDYLSPLAMLFVPHAWPPSLEEDVIGPLRDLPDAERVAPGYLYPRWAPVFSTLPANVGSIHVTEGGLPAYAQLFPLLPPPRSIARWQDDDYFAYQRLNGPNPMVIRQVRRRNELPEQFAVTDALFQRVTGGRATLADEIAEGRIFLSDYALLAPAQGIHKFPDPEDPIKTLGEPAVDIGQETVCSRVWPCSRRSRVRLVAARGSKALACCRRAIVRAWRR